MTSKCFEYGKKIVRVTLNDKLEMFNVAASEQIKDWDNFKVIRCLLCLRTMYELIVIIISLEKAG